jgi:hypothetical protein
MKLKRVMLVLIMSAGLVTVAGCPSPDEPPGGPPADPYPAPPQPEPRPSPEFEPRPVPERPPEPGTD